MATLDLFELDHGDPDKLSIPLNFSSIDFRDIGVRKGTFSRTIKLPSTKANDMFFGLNFEVTNEGLFDDKVKIPITINRIEFRGFMQLNGVGVKDGETDSYSVNIFSDLVDWTALVGGGSIRELKHLTSHALIESNVRASWNTWGIDTGVQYVYPLINYGNYITPTTDINLTKWLPSFYVYPLIVQIFKEAGYRFIGKHLSTSKLSNLILPFMGDKFFTTDEVSVDTNISTLDISVRTNTTSANSTTLISGSPGPVPIIANMIVLMGNVITDHRDAYNASTGKYIAPHAGSYSVSLDIDRLDYGYTNTGAIGPAVVMEVIFNASNGGTINSTTLSSDIFFGSSGSVSLSASENFTLSEGQVVWFSLKMTPANTGAILGVGVIEGTMDFTPANNLIVEVLEDGDVAEEGAVITTTTETHDAVLVDHKGAIQDIKKLDLLKEVMILGNYRVVTDNNAKTVDFVPEDSFFNSSAKDWTYKKDNSKNINISLIRNDGARSLEFGYSNDTSDKMITNTEGNYRMTNYASERVQMESEHRIGSQTIHKSIFSATIDEFGLPVMMKDIAPDAETGEVVKVFEADFSNRLLVWGGAKPGNYTFFGRSSSGYPYAYFAGSNFSIAFNKPFGELKSGFGGRAEGIVNAQYASTIRKLNNAKMLKGYFWLDDYDIATLDFGRPIIVNDVQYYINKVIDYRVGANQPTLVELISRV
jgi:hypothetical protein